MLSHIRGLTASPRARYTLKWEVQIPTHSGRSFELHHRRIFFGNQQSSSCRTDLLRRHPIEARGEVAPCTDNYFFAAGLKIACSRVSNKGVSP